MSFRSFLLRCLLLNKLGNKLNNKRYISETAQEAKITAIVEPIIQNMGYDLVRVKILHNRGVILQIMAEDKNGNFTISDCEKLSREINPALDVEEPINSAYQLEISSPGIDRPLVRVRDFLRHIGDEAKIELVNMLNGQKRFRGEIIACDDENVTLKLSNITPDKEPQIQINLAQIANAKLIMSDKLLKQAKIKQQNEDVFDNPDIEIIHDNKENI